MKNIKKIYKELPNQHKALLYSTSLILLILMLIPSEKASASRQNNATALKVGERYQLDLPQQLVYEDTTETVSSETQNPSDDVEPEQESRQWQTAKVKRGDSLAKILKRLGYSAQTTYKLTKASGDYRKQLLKINVGDTLRFSNNADGELAFIEYPISKTQTLLVELTDKGYHTDMLTKEVEIREYVTQGSINSNFWTAGVSAGLNDNQIINLAHIFSWDVDFALDIRKGDTFHVVYESKYVDGEYIGTGNILAAEFINQGEVFQAIRHNDGRYYTPEGNSMRKAFLRAPVEFKYISSNFKPKRFHPIQKRWKAHRGTDYRANTGTPVVASGDGKVTHSTYNKYNGHYVFIQHGNGIVTKYLHFSKRAVKQGQRVKQGQVIGYVGSTGMSEAPHLHYEFLVNGVHRNPRTVTLPDAEPIAKSERASFNIIARQRLNDLAGSRLALNPVKEKATQAP
ncbi:family M23 zinc metallopeptidase with OapA domain protein [Thalassotalea marina]|uniref:Family M23 zinc metallopeptidase with OapA domain protein n=2 Tax=Thalassotalea marina TaxID=1673741 RepID=A0A919EGQ6_9GAMM|nr:family M23 zinc metallopeptidase with OapA domain protein [Thalassotalea marina]